MLIESVRILCVIGFAIRITVSIAISVYTTWSYALPELLYINNVLFININIIDRIDGIRYHHCSINFARLTTNSKHSNGLLKFNIFLMKSCQCIWLYIEYTYMWRCVALRYIYSKMRISNAGDKIKTKITKAISLIISLGLT